jgi:hypothetical protein
MSTIPWRKTAKGQAWLKAYKNSPEVRAKERVAQRARRRRRLKQETPNEKAARLAKARAYYRIYYQRPGVKPKFHKWNRSAEGKAWRSDYERRPEVKVRNSKRRRTPSYRAKKRQRYRASNQRATARAWESNPEKQARRLELDASGVAAILTRIDAGDLYSEIATDWLIAPHDVSILGRAHGRSRKDHAKKHPSRTPRRNPTAPELKILAKLIYASASVKYAAKVLGVSHNVVGRWVKELKIPYAGRTKRTRRHEAVRKSSRARILPDGLGGVA